MIHRQFLHTMIYKGPSMAPTFRSGDLLRVAPAGVGEIRRGDVLVFRSPEQEAPRLVVHRVISVGPEGVICQGDNNALADAPVAAEQIVGIAVEADQGRGWTTVIGGCSGYRRFRMNQIRGRVRRGVLRAASPVYNGLARTGIFQSLCSRWVEVRVFSFGRRQGRGRDLCLYVRGRCVGRYDETLGTWRVRRPFRLLIPPRYIASPMK